MLNKYFTSTNYPNIEKALNRVIQQKANYERNLLNKRFVYIFVDKNNQIDFREVLFKKTSYLHLTGLDYKGKQSQKRQGVEIDGTDALEFYNRLGNDDTLISDVSFTQGSTTEDTLRFFRYTQHKLDNLSELTQLSNKADFIGKYVGDRDFDIIVNRNFSSLALLQQRSIFLPASLLFGKPQSVATDIKPVLAIFSKDQDSHKFVIQYLNKKISLSNVKMSIELAKKLTPQSFENDSVAFNQDKLSELTSIYKSAVRYGISKQLTELSSKRNNSYRSEADMNTYIKSVAEFTNSIRDTFEAQIAIDVLTEQNKTNPNDLIKDEISEIRQKFGLSVPTLSAVAATQPLEIHAHEEKSIFVKPVMQNNGTMVLSPAVPPNDLFTQLVNTLVKGLDNVVHKISTTMDKLNYTATKALNSLFAQKPSRTSSRASQSKSKDNSPKKAKSVKKERYAAPVKHSAQKQEQRSSVLAEIKSIKAEQQAQDKPERSHQRSKTKSNDREI